jgi:hypothetical protein
MVLGRCCWGLLEGTLRLLSEVLTRYTRKRSQLSRGEPEQMCVS